MGIAMNDPLIKILRMRHFDIYNKTPDKNVVDMWFNTTSCLIRNFLKSIVISET
jgi:hypothetical protein